MDSNTSLRTNFANGMVSYSISVRTDWVKEESSVKEATNFIVTSSGGMKKRPGMEYLGDALPVVINGVEHPPRLYKFEFSLGQTYVIEFGHREMRIWLNDALILNDDGTEYKIETPYTYEQILNATGSQYKDTIIFTHWDLPIQRLTRGPSDTHTNWYWEAVIIGELDLLPAPTGVRFISDGHNGVSYTVTTLKDGQESKGLFTAISTPLPDYEMPDTVPVWSDDPVQAYVNVFGWLAKYQPTHGLITGFPRAPERLRNLAGITNEMILVSASGTSGVNSIWRLHEEIDTIFGEINDVPKSAVTQGSITWQASMVWSYGLFSNRNNNENHYINRGWCFNVPLTHSKLYEIFNIWFYEVRAFTLNVRAVGLGRGSGSGVHLDGPGATSIGSAGSSNTTFNSGSVAIRNFIMTKVFNGEWNSTYQTRKMYDAIMTFMDTAIQKPGNKIAWNPVPGATSYNIYRRNLNSSIRYFGLLDTISATSTEYEDVDISESVADMTKSPPEIGQYFDRPGLYPHVNTLFQQRLILGSTKEAPLMMGGSVPGIFNDFSEPAEDNPYDESGAFTFELMSATSNPIRHFIPIRTLYILSEAGAFVSTVSGAITRINVNFNQEAYLGSSEIPPVIVDRSAIYVPLNRQSINSLQYSYVDDAFVDDNILFAALDLLRDSPITSLDHLRPNINLIACTTEEGRVLVCTFIPKQQFSAWTQLETNGEVNQVCTCTNDEGYDDLYAVVKRFGKFFIEKFSDFRVLSAEPNMENSMYLDSALKGDFTSAVSHISGLEHLEGQSVYAVVDMSVQGPFVVNGGSIDLKYPGLKVHVGLPYRAVLETLDIVPHNLVTLKGTSRKLYTAYVNVEKTGDLKYRLNSGEEFRVVFQDNSSLGLPPKIYTGEKELEGSIGSNKETKVKFTSDMPLPCTINSLAAEIQYAG